MRQMRGRDLAVTLIDDTVKVSPIHGRMVVLEAQKKIDTKTMNV